MKPLFRIDARTSVPVIDICYVDGSGNYSVVRTTDHKSYMLSKTLMAVEYYLPQFVRCNKKHLINPAHITGHRFMVLGQRKTLFLDMSDGSLLSVSRRKTKLFLTALMEHGSLVGLEWSPKSKIVPNHEVVPNPKRFEPVNLQQDYRPPYNSQQSPPKWS